MRARAATFGRKRFSRDFSCASAPAELKQFRKVTDSVALYVQVSGGRHGGNPVFTMTLATSNFLNHAPTEAPILRIQGPLWTPLFSHTPTLKSLVGEF